MKFKEDRPFATPESAERKLLELANAMEADHAGGDGLGHNLNIGDDSRLASVDHVVTLLVAAKDPAFNEANAAGAANPAAAVVRQFNTIHQRPVEQEVSAIR